MSRPLRLVPVALLALAFALVNCPPTSDTQAATNNAITVCAFDSLKYSVKTITMPAPGVLKVTFHNRGSIRHTFTVKSKNFDLEAPGKNDTKTGDLNLDAPGTYDFVCTVPGHEQAGMKGKIVVS
jgi:plastocyanin